MIKGRHVLEEEEKKGNQLDRTALSLSVRSLSRPSVCTTLEESSGEFHGGFPFAFFPRRNPPLDSGTVRCLLFLVYHDVISAVPFPAITPVFIENAR